MRCGRTRRLLPLFVGGDLGERDAGGVRDHLERCAACRAERDSLADARKSLFVLKGLSGPAPDLWPAVRRGLHPRRARPVRSGSGRRSPLRAAAGVLALLGAGAAALLFPGGRDVPPDSAPAGRTMVEAPRPTRGTGRFELAEVGPAAGRAGFGAFHAVTPPDPQRRTWDDF